MSDFSSKPLFHINIFTPKTGQLEEFIASQTRFAERLGTISTLTETRFFRAEDGSSGILMGRWESAEAFRDFQSSAAFQEERARLAPLLESTRPGFYRLIRERRAVQ